jgi:hypothetical protein
MQTPPAPIGTGGIRRCSSQVRGARTIDHERCRHLLRCTPPDLPLGLLAAQSQMQAVLAAGLGARAVARLDRRDQGPRTRRSRITRQVLDRGRALRRAVGHDWRLSARPAGSDLAALYPENINPLTPAGAPIDFHVGEPLHRGGGRQDRASRDGPDQDRPARRLEGAALVDDRWVALGQGSEYGDGRSA